MDDNRVRLRKFIANVFSDEELDVFCFDYFPEVYSNLPREQTLIQKTLHLLTYCLKRNQIDILTDALKRERPQQFAAEFIETEGNIQKVSITDNSSEVGYLDLEEAITEKLTHSKMAVERIVIHVEKVGVTFSQATGELNDVAAEKRESPKSQTKRIVNRVASQLYQFGDQIEVETGLFATNFTESVLNVKHLITVALEMPNREQQMTEVRNLVPQLENLLLQMDKGRSGMMQFRIAVSKLPRMTSELTRSRNRAAKALDGLLAEFDTARNAVTDCINHAQSVS